jgi:hypothetical protein
MANLAMKLPQETVEEQFTRLAEEWQSAVAHLSSATKRDNHRAYREIIGMGPIVVPFLLRDLETHQRHWFTALSAITGANPITEQDAGNIANMAKAWFAWGKKEGYQW